MLSRLVRLVPGRLLGLLHTLYWRGGLPGRLAAWATSALRYRTATIARGIGAGLRFNPSGANVAYALGISEPRVQDAFGERLRAGAVFYDIGANVGFFTVLGARLVGPRGRVYAFEPLPENAAALRANVGLNGFANVTVIERAAAAAPGTGRLRLADHPTLATLRANADDRGGRTVDVGLVAIDDLVQAGEIAPPDLVKIDVEGSELDVLRGMRVTLERHRPVVICELHDTNRGFAELMHELRYAVTVLRAPGSVEHAAADVHALAMPAA